MPQLVGRFVICRLALVSCCLILLLANNTLSDKDDKQATIEKQFLNSYVSLYKCLENDTSTSHTQQMRILITGGAGFVGSHLVDKLMLAGHKVVVIDNLSTGRMLNIQHWLEHANFKLLKHDVCIPLNDLNINKLDQIYHLAAPASPAHYMLNQTKTIKTIVLGTINMLELALKLNAQILIASTSEIYGDPQVHPQVESYLGNTNIIGPRSCYDESKRVSESLAVAYRDQYNVSIRIARIFNTYGPRMHPNDGRVVANFISQSIRNEPLTIYGDGKQTRSFQYITDLVNGLEKLMESHVMSPVNLGNPIETTIVDLAHIVKSTTCNSTSYMLHKPLPIDDPHRRQPDIRKATKLLNWIPTVDLKIGLKKTLEYFRQELQD